MFRSVGIYARMNSSGLKDGGSQFKLSGRRYMSGKSVPGDPTDEPCDLLTESLKILCRIDVAVSNPCGFFIARKCHNSRACMDDQAKSPAGAESSPSHQLEKEQMKQELCQYWGA